MRIAIVSDIHDNVWNLRFALSGMPRADVLLCCGDLCSPFVVGLLVEGFPGRPIHVVFGNNDGDLFRIAQQASNAGTVQLHGAIMQQTFDGRRVTMNHYPEIALAIARTGADDLVCYGHNHLFRVEQLGATLTVNPGPLMGYEPGGRRDVPATLLHYDTTAGAVEAYRIDAATGTLLPHDWTT